MSRVQLEACYLQFEPNHLRGRDALTPPAPALRQARGPLLNDVLRLSRQNLHLFFFDPRVRKDRRRSADAVFGNRRRPVTSPLHTRARTRSARDRRKLA